MENETDCVAIERRIERFIALIGFAGSIVAAAWGWRPAAGVAAGGALCWLNFRWLRQGAEGVIRVGLAQAGAANVSVPRSLHAKFFGRLILLGITVYAILVWLRLPALAVVSGLTAVLPAILLELGYEAVRNRSH